MGDFCQLWVTCKNQTEADKIASTLLSKRLVACARQTLVNSTYKWQGKIDSSEEVMLLMESRIDLFDEIEREVAKAHSYDTFVLEAVPVGRISKKAAKWLDSELKNDK